MSHLWRKLTGEPEEESLLEGDCLSLTYKQRLYGAVACGLLGFLAAGLSTLYILSLKLTKFAILYTIGNILALGSTMFIVGPWRQFKNMTKKNRLIASGIYVLALAGTLWAALKPDPSVILVILMVVIQFCALIWYCLSYVPGGRATCSALAKSCV
eukprot:TRINITY_DN5697_c0_g1_i2.p3 TRINITY_DN5697_c0_g1~~TRINITY_DN5697_c0_g1_i2.p3  ORF type:complete len:156 (-),score=27.37 TRINITY_DN5697_c0_g1_i2:655-1122(-)